MPRNEFRFNVEPRYRLPLLLYGLTKGRANVTVEDDILHIRFGPWVVDTPTHNVEVVEETGPYRWWRAIGIRMSLVDRGITFGTTTTSGVCMKLKEPVSVHLGRLTVPLRHPGITVTVDDPQALAGLLRS
jgi:hypothetical protein